MVAVLASVPSNVEGGSYMTFGGPVGLFVVVATILWLMFARPHRRVPPRRAMVASQAGTGNVSTASAVAPPAASTASGGSTGATAAAGATAADEGAEPQQDTSTDYTEASE